jgi:hypothetical protein
MRSMKCATHALITMSLAPGMALSVAMPPASGHQRVDISMDDQGRDKMAPSASLRLIIFVIFITKSRRLSNWEFNSSTQECSYAPLPARATTPSLLALGPGSDRRSLPTRVRSAFTTELPT